MVVRFIKIFLVLTLTTSAVFAQQAADPNGPTSVSSGPRKQLATIIFAGLAGAILGLSTLSFYGRPQDKLSNIAVGFAIGIIVGTSYTTYKAATEPYEYLSDFKEFDQNKLSLKADPSLITVGHSWNF